MCSVPLSRKESRWCYSRDHRNKNVKVLLPFPWVFGLSVQCACMKLMGSCDSVTGTLPDYQSFFSPTFPGHNSKWEWHSVAVQLFGRTGKQLNSSSWSWESGFDAKAGPSSEIPQLRIIAFVFLCWWGCCQLCHNQLKAKSSWLAQSQFWGSEKWRHMMVGEDHVSFWHKLPSLHLETGFVPNGTLRKDYVIFSTLVIFYQTEVLSKSLDFSGSQLSFLNYFF